MAVFLCYRLSSCCFSFDGFYAITGDNSGYVSVWDANKGVFLCQVNADDLGVNCVASAPQALGQEGEVALEPSSTGTPGVCVVHQFIFKVSSSKSCFTRYSLS